MEKVRSKAVERVVLLAAYVRYACEEGESDVWAEYVREASEPSLSGSLTWLEENDVGRLLDEAIGMFPRREMCWTRRGGRAGMRCSRSSTPTGIESQLLPRMFGLSVADKGS